MKDWNLTMNCSRNMITYPEKNSMSFICTLVTVTIIMSKKKYGRRKTLDVVASSLFSTCEVDII